MKKLVINRKRWLRGESGAMSELYRKDRKMCCLGFYARSCGYRVKDIRGKTSPHYLIASLDVVAGLKPLLIFNASGLAYDNSDVCQRMMTTNDDTNISDAAREQDLKRYFKEIDVAVEFVG